MPLKAQQLLHINAHKRIAGNDDVVVFKMFIGKLAADYVYIVDPWWNPAVEQQAIDRTHRIGQTQKIFAYKMICKDTVEEKILQLQQRKKQIANELVTEDSGFIKKLSKEDVEFLFSWFSYDAPVIDVQSGRVLKHHEVKINGNKIVEVKPISKLKILKR